MTLYLKACPRCHGDIALDDDQYGRYMECLQCGHESEPVAEAEQESQPLYSREAASSKVEAA